MWNVAVSWISPSICSQLCMQMPGADTEVPTLAGPYDQHLSCWNCTCFGTWKGQKYHVFSGNTVTTMVCTIKKTHLSRVHDNDFHQNGNFKEIYDFMKEQETWAPSLQILDTEVIATMAIKGHIHKVSYMKRERMCYPCSVVIAK